MASLTNCVVSNSRRILIEEEGQAMAEMAVLLPVYLLFLILAMYIGQHQLVRQQTLEAARYFAWNGKADGAISTEEEFFPRFRSDGATNMTGADQPGQNLAPIPLSDSEVKKHLSGNQGALSLATQYMNNLGRTDFGERHVVVSFRGLRIPVVSRWLGVELKATRQHHVYVLRNPAHHSRNLFNDYRFGRPEGENGQRHFLFTFAQGEVSWKDENGIEQSHQFDHASKLPKFLDHQWWPIRVFPNFGQRGSITSESFGTPGNTKYNNMPVLWNRQHELQSGYKPHPKKNPFYEHYWDFRGNPPFRIR